MLSNRILGEYNSKHQAFDLPTEKLLSRNSCISLPWNLFPTQGSLRSLSKQRKQLCLAAVAMHLEIALFSKLLGHTFSTRLNNCMGILRYRECALRFQ